MRELDVLSYRQKLAKRLRKKRIQEELSQRELATRIGVTQPYLAQIENGHRPISAACLARLEKLYRMNFGALRAGVGKRGRPRYEWKTRQALRLLGRAVRQFWRAAEVPVPKHSQPHQVRTLVDPLWTIALRLGEGAGDEVRRLESLRRGDDNFWRQFNSLRFDSWSEKRLQVRVALLGVPLVGVRLARLGCKLPLIDGVTGKAAGLHRAFILKGQEASLAWCPQVTVRTGVGYRCVDNLLVMSDGSKSVTLAVELDGAPYHQDRQKEKRRDLELAIPVLHVDANRLDEPGLIARILTWAKSELEAA